MRNLTRKGLPIKRKSERKQESITVAEYKTIQPKPSKYRNVKTQVDAIVFDSAKEANRYKELRLLEAHGAISDLTIQPKFELKYEGRKLCVYKGDFSYYENNFLVVEDCKGFRTQVYRLKKKMMAIILGIEIREV